MARSLRPKIDILSSSPTIDDKIIDSSKLPTHRQVLMSYLAYREEISSHKKNHLVACKVCEHVKKHYLRGNIPIIDDKNVIQSILRLHGKFMAVQKVPLDRRSGSKLVIDFKDQLDKTMMFWPENALSLIEYEEDRQFLRQMMTTREGHMGGEDRVFRRKQDAKQEREAAEGNRKERERKRKADDTYLYESHQLDVEDCHMYATSDQGGSQRKHNRRVKTGESIFIPHDILKDPQVVSCMVRNRISPAAAASLVHSIISASNGDPSKFCIHETTALRLVAI